MALRLEVAGIGAVQRSLRDLRDELDNFESLWADYALVMVQTEEDWFASNGGGTWPPLAPSTVRDKVSHGWPVDTLIRTGNLLESLTNPGVAMEIGQGRSTIGTFTRKSMTWGTSVTDERGREYAHYHQHSDPVTGEPYDYGTEPPERQVIPWPLPAHTQVQLEAANEAFVAAAIERSGLGG